jgi:NAD(P)-dependent dehydrogenase (short-subunit alcohol dehydrogenase family)
MKGELDIVFNACKAARPPPPALAHAADKGGVIAMTHQLAMEGGRHGIRANSISPGLVRTGATAAYLTPAGRPGPGADHGA